LPGFGRAERNAILITARQRDVQPRPNDTGRLAREQVARQLRIAYDDCKEWDLPKRLKDLLEQLRTLDPEIHQADY
jgi:hypothetical protein